MSIIDGLRESFRLPDLRRRILITLLILIVYRFAANIPVPGIDRLALEQALSPDNPGSGFLSVLDLLSGGAVSNMSVLAMGVYPYITASIIIQILTPIIPALEELAKEGQAGRDKINRYTYYLAIPMAVFNAIGQINLIRAQAGGAAIIPGFGSDVLVTATVLTVMTAGTMFAIWLGELITEDGIGNGLSLIIFAGIVARIPDGIASMFLSTETATIVRNVSLFVLLTIITLVVIVIVQEGQRRIPVKYGKRVRGTKMYGGGSTYLPVKVNTAGMIPLIFASSILSFPAVIANVFSQTTNPTLKGIVDGMTIFFGNQGGTQTGLQSLYWFVYFLMVVGFTYLYTDIMVRNQNIAFTLQRSGGAIPGVQPGKNTESFIQKVYQRVTLVGALFLGLVAVLPGLVQIVMELIQPGAGAETRRALLIVSGGGLIIIVGVVLDTMRQLEAQLVMRHRDTFIR